MKTRCDLVFNPAALRAIRGLHRMSGPQLAEAAGLDRSQMWRIERGMSEPKRATVDRLAAVLGVPTSALLMPPATATADDAPAEAGARP